MNLAEALAENAALRHQNALQLAQIEGLEQLVEALKAEIEELRQRLGLNSQTSSLPPSSDGPKKPPPRQRTPSDRKPGGQPGHTGTTLRQTDTPDTHIDLYPQTCSNCQAQLAEEPSVGQPVIRQEFDLPPNLKLHVTQYAAHAVVCPRCGHKNRAAFPPGLLSAAQYGSGLKGLMAYLYHQHCLPYARGAELIGDLFGGSVSAATLVNTTRELAAALAPLQAEREARLAAAPVSQADETGLRVAGLGQWVHAHCAQEVVQLYLHVSRGRNGMQHLAQQQGVVVHDGYLSYRNWGQYAHALCNAHHLRELEFMARVRKHPWATTLQELLLEALHETEAARCRGQTALDEEVLEAYRSRFALVVQAALKEQPPGQAPARGRKRNTKEFNLLTRLDEGLEAVWRFASDFAVPFTNNLSERNLRMLKVKMKVSGCFRTESGAREHLGIRSTLLTAKASQTDVLELFRTSHHAWRGGHQPSK